LLGELNATSGHLQKSLDLNIAYLKQDQSENGYTKVRDYIWSVNPTLYQTKKCLLDIESYPDTAAWSLYAQYEEAGGYQFEIQIEKTLDELGFETSILARNFNTLSGGEKTKLAFLRILMTAPHLLLLDEPTNNLDIQAIRW